MKRSLLLVPLLVACLVTGCIGVETYEDEGQAIETKVNQEFVIALGANRTTGYGWEASYDEAVLELVEIKYEEAGEGLIGAGGVEKVLEVALSDDEKQALEGTLAAVKKTVAETNV